MLPRMPIPEALLQLIAAQAGAVSSRQALAYGLTPKALRRIAKQWTPLAPGFYVVGEVTWKAFARIALLRGGPDAALGGAAAAHVLGLIIQPPSTISVWSSGKRTPLTHGRLRAVYRRGQRRAWGQLRRTTADQALLDLAGEADEATLVEGITRACANRVTTPSRLLEALAQRERQARRVLIERVCAAAEVGVESVLEWLFQEHVVLPHRITAAARQVRVLPGHRTDMWFEDEGVLVELDSRGFHDVDADAIRDNEHALALGIVTLRFTWRQVLREPCKVARVLVEALRARGWKGTYRPCAHC